MSSSGNGNLFSRLRNSISTGFNNYIQQNKYLKSASYVIPRIKAKIAYLITDVLQDNIVKAADNITKYGGVISKKYKNSINNRNNKKNRENKKNNRNQATRLNRSALNSIKEYDIYVRYENDIYNQLNFTMSDKIDIIRSCLKEYKSLKINEQIKIIFKKLTPDAAGRNTYQTTEFTARSPIQTITDPDYHDIMYMLETTRDNIESRINKFTFEGSAWVVDKILEHNLIISKYDPLRGSNYIPLPDKYSNRKACINIQNKDDKCFIYCLARALDKNPEKLHLERVSKHLLETCEKLGLNKIKTPVGLNESTLKEIENTYDISINIFYLIIKDHDNINAECK